MVNGEVEKGGEVGGAMRKRRTLMADGRYLIYYTFGDVDDAPSDGEAGASARPEPDADAAAGEERLV